MELENISRDKQVEIDRLASQLEKLQTELMTYQDLLSVKDDQIVKLTNQIHELELKNVINTSVPPSPGGPRTLSNLSLHKVAVTRTTSNGISFDSDKGEFKEFIDVAVQTNDRSSYVSFHLNDPQFKEHLEASFLSTNLYFQL